MLYCRVFNLNADFIIVLHFHSFTRDFGQILIDCVHFFPVMLPEQGDDRAVTVQKYSLTNCHEPYWWMILQLLFLASCRASNSNSATASCPLMMRHSRPSSSTCFIGRLSVCIRATSFSIACSMIWPLERKINIPALHGSGPPPFFRIDHAARLVHKHW